MKSFLLPLFLWNDQTDMSPHISNHKISSFLAFTAFCRARGLGIFNPMLLWYILGHLCEIGSHPCALVWLYVTVFKTIFDFSKCLLRSWEGLYLLC